MQYGVKFTGDFVVRARVDGTEIALPPGEVVPVKDKATAEAAALDFNASSPSKYRIEVIELGPEEEEFDSVAANPEDSEG